MDRYVDSLAPDNDYQEAVWLYFSSDAKLLVDGDEILRSLLPELGAGKVEPDDSLRLFLGTFDGRPVHATVVEADAFKLPSGRFVGLRDLYGSMDDDERALAGRAWQLLHWRRVTRFCSVCGTGMEDKPDERARQCPACGHIVFPRINPAVITAVTKGDRLLLAHNDRFPAGLYSLVAGFVEVGERLEDAVAREIREEVGIEVKNIRYFGSQPWPFPSNLMLGFTAEHAAGELNEDGNEIIHAEWFPPDGLPSIPRRGSISRELIDAYLKGHNLC